MFRDRTPHEGAQWALRAACTGAGLPVPILAVQMGEVTGRLELTRPELALVIAGLLVGAVLGTLAGRLAYLRTRSRVTLAAGAWVGAATLTTLGYAPGTAWAVALATLVGSAAGATYVTLARYLRHHVAEWDQRPLRRYQAVGAFSAAVGAGLAVEMSGSAEIMLVVLALGTALLFTYAAWALNSGPPAVRAHGHWKGVALRCSMTLPLAAVLYWGGARLRADLEVHPRFLAWGLLVAVLVLAFSPRGGVTTYERAEQCGLGFVAVFVAADVSVAVPVLEAVTSRPVGGVLVWIAALAVALMGLIPARELVIDTVGGRFAVVTSWLTLAGCTGYTTGPVGFGTPAPGDALQHAVLFAAALLMAGVAWVVAVVRARRDRDMRQ